MSERSENSLKHIKDLFAKEPDAEEKSWVILNDFYHYLLTWMEKNNVSKADLARILGKSRASVTKMLLHNPNISIKKIVEITHPLGLDIKIGIEQIPESLSIQKAECVTEKYQTTTIADVEDWLEVPRIIPGQSWQILETLKVMIAEPFLDLSPEVYFTNNQNQPADTVPNNSISALKDSQYFKECAYA